MPTEITLALRALRREPVVCFAVIAILTVSIGVHTAVFSLINAALLRPISDRDADRMVVVESVSQKTGGEYGLSLPDGDDYLRDAEKLDSIGSFESRRDNLILDDGTTISLPSAMVTSGVLPSTGVSPSRGRLFTTDDDHQGADSFKALVSEALWRSHLGGREDILGKRIRTSLGTYTVVGVLPAGFGFPAATQLWFPYQNWVDTQDTGDTRDDQRFMRWSEGIARLAPGATLDQAQQELTALAEGLAELHPKTNDEWRPRLTSYRESETAELRPHLRSLWVLTWVFLGLATVTLASLQTARGVARVSHFGLQRALGAESRRIAGQLLTETLLLAGIGGSLGLLLAAALVRTAPALLQEALPLWVVPSIGAGELALSVASVLVVSLLAGLAPLGLVLRRDLRSLVGQRTDAAGAGSTRLRRFLVVGEVALATLLIVGALLLAASFRNLVGQDPGFDPERVLTLELSPQFEGDYSEQTADLAQFYQRVQQALLEVPGVLAAGGATHLPYLDPDRRPVTIEARGGPTQEELAHVTPIVTIDQAPGYFDALGVPLLEGRDLAWTDSADDKVIVLSRGAAELLFPGRSAVGQQARIASDEWARVVGVVDDVRYDPRGTDFGVELYYPITQYKAWRQRVVVRTDGPPTALASAIRSKLEQAAPEAGVIEIRTLDSIMDGTLWQARLLGVLGPFFAVVSLLLAGLGIYGLLRSEFGMRRREFGLRSALGAPLGSLAGLVLAHGLRLVSVGLLFGVVAAFALGPALAASLFGVSARNPSIYAATIGVLLAAGALACLVPALHAMRVDPTSALRNE